MVDIMPPEPDSKCPVLNPEDMFLRATWPAWPFPALGPGASCVYFMWSADWELLYVGITNNPERRFAQHRRLKPWWRHVHHMEVEEYRSRDRALSRERETIAGWQPTHNVIRPRWPR